jgi:hypothetical protein
MRLSSRDKGGGKETQRFPGHRSSQSPVARHVVIAKQ